MDFKNEINKLAELYASNKNDCERRKIRDEMANILYKNQSKVYIKNDNDDKYSLISDAFISALQNFKSDKGATFYTYFMSALENKQKDLLNKKSKISRHEIFETDYNAKKEEDATSNISVDNFYNIKNSESDIYAVQVPDEEATDTLIATELAIKHMNLIINFYEFNRGKKANQVRYDYYKMFYTDNIGNAVRSEDCLKTFIIIEDKVQETMNLNFQDFYTKEPVRSLTALKKVKYKKHCEVVTGEASKELENPLPNNVFLEYYNQVNGIATSLPTVSQQKKAYKEYVQLLKKPEGD
jgi:DNA-directed RNA polymerase specialized sigma24 family protein